MSSKSYAEILIEKIEGNAYDDLSEAFVELMQEDLINKKYGRDIAEAHIDFITNNKDNIDYSNMLDIPEDSKWARKYLKIDLTDVYEKIGYIDTYAADVYEFISACATIDDALNENGKLTSEGRAALEKMLDSYLNISSNLAENIAVVGTAYSSLIDFVNQEVDFVVDIYMAKADANELYNMLSEDGNSLDLSSSTVTLGWYSIYEGLVNRNPECWKNTAITPDNPDNMTLSWEEVYRLYNKYPEYSDVLDPYIEWRINYEYQMALEGALEEKGLTVEEYIKQLEDEADIFVQKDSNANPLSYYTMDGIAMNSLGRSYLIQKIISSFVAAKIEKNCTPVYSSSIFYSHTLDPLILDLDNDGYNVETKENGTNFDLDKNGFAEKINWTTKDGFLCLDLKYVNPHLA